MIIIIKTEDQEIANSILALVESGVTASVSIIKEPREPISIGLGLTTAIENFSHEIRERGIILVEGGAYHPNLAIRHNLPGLEKLDFEKLGLEKMCHERPTPLHPHLKKEFSDEREAFFSNQGESKKWSARNFKNCRYQHNQTLRKGKMKK
jgi:hypothetical protein